MDNRRGERGMDSRRGERGWREERREMCARGRGWREERSERDVCERKRLARREEVGEKRGGNGKRAARGRKRLARRENGTVRELRAGGRGWREEGRER
jgi:hypothetical protein